MATSKKKKTTRTKSKKSTKETKSPKSKAIDVAVSQIEKQFGKGSIMKRR